MAALEYGVIAEDPLGACPYTKDFKTLCRWNETEVPVYDIMVDDPSCMKVSPFPYREDLNAKMILWSGDLTELNAEAIVNSTNESLNDRNPLSERIFKRAGHELRDEIRTDVKGCKTGEAKITKGYKLPARFIIHTVGPRYNIRYKTAAESALYSAYRNVLQLVKEKEIKSIAFCCIHTQKRGYPPYEAGHIAIRTVRRYLEKYENSLDTVIFVVTGDDEDVYISLMPLYFPRSKSEEDFAAYHLPYDIGNEDGEPIIAERKIRILGKPTTHAQQSVTEDLEESVDISAAFETSVAVGNHAFSKMEADKDRERKIRVRKQLSEQLQIQEQERRYERWVRRARHEDLSEIAALNCLYPSGYDKYNRAVVIFVAKNFPATRVNLEKALMYFISTMDPIVSQPFVVLYLHTQTTRENQPELSFIKDIYNITDMRYKKNLKGLYIIHGTFWSKVVAWFMTTFSLSDLKSKICSLPGIEYLHTRIPPDQLQLPHWVIDYDMKVNGTRYYSPEEDTGFGTL